MVSQEFRMFSSIVTIGCGMALLGMALTGHALDPWVQGHLGMMYIAIGVYLIVKSR